MKPTLAILGRTAPTLAVVPKRVSIAFAVALFIAVGVVTWQFLLQREPVYQGKPLSFWLEQARQSDWLDQTTETAIHAMGSHAVPALLRRLEVRDSSFRKVLAYLSSEQDWVKIHIQPRQEIRAMAEYGFRVLGSAAKPAVPNLVKLLHDTDSEIRDSAAGCLGLIGSAAHEAVPTLIKYLTVASKPGTTRRPHQFHPYRPW